EARELRCALAREFSGAGELLPRVDELERVLDRRGRQETARELSGDRRAPEALALLQGRDEILGERFVVEQPDARQPVDLGCDSGPVGVLLTEDAFEFAL